LIFHEVTDKNKLAPFFMTHGVVYMFHLTKPRYLFKTDTLKFAQ